MQTFSVRFPATSLTPVMTFTVMADSPGEAHTKATQYVRANGSVPAGWTALGAVIPVKLKPGVTLNIH